MFIFRKPFNNWDIRFVYSPWFETLSSLHVLCAPQHHMRRLDWANEKEKVLPKSLMDEILYFGKAFSHWLGITGYGEDSKEEIDLSFDNIHNEMDKMDVAMFTYLFFNKDHYSKDIIARDIRTGIFSYEYTEAEKAFIKDPQAMKERILKCLMEYYTLFEKELKYIEPVLKKKLKYEKSKSEQMDFMKYIQTIHPRIEIKNNSFHFHKYTRFEKPFDEIDMLVIQISSFIDPHLLIGLDKHILALTIRASLEPLSDDIPKDLHNLLKAVGDGTRLKILKLLFHEPAPTQYIALQLGFTEAAISKHLKVLLKCNLVTKNRKGNYIYYELQKHTLDCIVMNLYEYFEGK